MVLLKLCVGLGVNLIGEEMWVYVVSIKQANFSKEPYTIKGRV